MLRPHINTSHIEARRAWIKALRSGDYRQAREALRTSSESGDVVGYCCLGVACDLYSTLVDGEWNHDDFIYPDPDAEPDGETINGVRRLETDIVYSAISSWLGLTNGEEKNLIKMNDEDECTFEEIADFLEETFPDYAEDPA